MKKILALFFTLTLITFAGCRKTDNNSSDYSVFTSEIILFEEDITSSEQVLSNKIPVDKTAVPSESAITAQESITSNTTTNSNNETETNDSEEQKVDTIILYHKTRYQGFLGYFTLDFAIPKEEEFEKYGIKLDNTKHWCWSGAPTEYCTSDSSAIRFVGICLDDKAYREDFFYDKEYFKTVVNIIDGSNLTLDEEVSVNCKTITKNQLITYLGYEGWFVLDCPYETANKKGYSSYNTEYYDVQTGLNVRFVFADPKYSNYDYDLEIEKKVKKLGRGSTPVNVVGDDIPLPIEKSKQ